MKFSIVIAVAPYRNAEVLESIKKIRYPEDKFEIIIERGTNPSVNRNLGAKKARGDLIYFIDDDAIVDENLLKNADEFFQKNPGVDIVGGPQLTPADDRGFAKISGYAFGSKFGAWKASNRYSGREDLFDVDETAVTSANLVLKKKVFLKISFDPSLFPGEDPKFISDAKKAGFRTAYSPNLKIYHRRRRNIQGLVKQMFLYGKVRPLKEKFKETLMMPFFLIPGLFVIYLLVLIAFLISNIFILYPKICSYLLFFPLMIYIILLIIFSLLDSYKNKDYKAVFILATIYPLIHISYGSGMIFGYLKKLRVI